MSNACSLPKVRMSPGLPNAFSLSRPKQAKLLNLTEKVYNILLPPIPDRNDVTTISAAILGRRGSGKSVMMTGFAKRAYDTYGAENLNIIWSTSLKYCIDRMDEKPVQLLLIDDAMEEQSSRRIHKNTKDLAKYHKLRHLHEKVCLRGSVITVWAWQRWMDLDPAYKDSLDIIFLKTGQTDETEKQSMRRIYGDTCYKYITKNWGYMMTGDNNAKSRSIVHMMPLEGTGMENGVFIQRMVDFPQMPPFVDYSLISSEAEETPVKESVPKKADDPKWALKVKCYNKIVLQSLDCRTAGRQLKVSHMTASRYAKEVQSFLAEQQTAKPQEAET